MGGKAHECSSGESGFTFPMTVWYECRLSVGSMSLAWLAGDELFLSQRPYHASN